MITASAATVVRSRFLCGILGGSSIIKNTIFAATIGTRLRTRARRNFGERDLRPRLAACASLGLDAHRPQERQHFAHAAPEPAGRLGPCFLALDVDVHLFSFYLEFGMEVAGQARPLVAALHE